MSNDLGPNAFDAEVLDDSSVSNIEGNETVKMAHVLSGVINKDSKICAIDSDCELAQDEDLYDRLDDPSFDWKPFLLGFARADHGTKLLESVLKGDEVNILTVGSFRTPDYYKVVMEPVFEEDQIVAARFCVDRIADLPEPDSRFDQVVPVCSACKKVRININGRNEWLNPDDVFNNWVPDSFLQYSAQIEYLSGLPCSHGFCKECFEDYYPGFPYEES